MNLRSYARSAAQREGLDPNIFERQISVESRFNAGARSPAGALGIAQFMPDTAKGLGIDPMNPKQALDAAAKYMAQNVKKYGNYENALRAYNAGPANIAKSHGFAETNAYVAKILHGSHAATLTSPTRAGVSVSSKTTSGTSGSVTPAHEVADPTAAALAALAQLPKVGAALPKVGSSGLLGRLESNIASGQYTKTVPTKVTLGKDPTVSTTVTRAPAGAVARKNGRLLPVEGGGKVIGVPYQGTHTLGNWQSDNAVDIAAPVGTPLVALQDGVVVKVTHHPQNGGRFAGDQITVRGANGNSYFYGHGSKTDVKPGQRIRRGQIIGRSGAANGVAHLHFGQEQGDPREHT